MAKKIWSEEAMEWGSKNARTGKWVRSDPPRPDWADEPAGLAARFVRIWSSSDSISAVRRSLFWVSMEELLAHYRSLNAFLINQGYAPLQLLPLRSGGPPPELPPILSVAELAALASEKVIRSLSAPEEPPAQDASVDAAPDDSGAVDGGDGEELDLTPSPPRPDEDPYRGVSPLSLAIPGYGNHDPLAEYYIAIGSDKMRIRIKH
jgi:hypothetical protein